MLETLASNNLYQNSEQASDPASPTYDFIRFCQRYSHETCQQQEPRANKVRNTPKFHSQAPSPSASAYISRRSSDLTQLELTARARVMSIPAMHTECTCTGFVRPFPAPLLSPHASFPQAPRPTSSLSRSPSSEQTQRLQNPEQAIGISLPSSNRRPNFATPSNDAKKKTRSQRSPTREPSSDHREAARCSPRRSISHKTPWDTFAGSKKTVLQPKKKKKKGCTSAAKAHSTPTSGGPCSCSTSHSMTLS